MIRGIIWIIENTGFVLMVVVLFAYILECIVNFKGRNHGRV